MTRKTITDKDGDELIVDTSHYRSAIISIESTRDGVNAAVVINREQAKELGELLTLWSEEK